MKIKILDKHCTPNAPRSGDAGLDLLAGENVSLGVGGTFLMPVGIAVEIPEGFVGIITPRSGLGSRGLILSNSVGIIDRAYRGQVKVPLTNTSKLGDTFNIERGDKIAQMIVVKNYQIELEIVEELSETVRGADGFGSTG